MSALTALVLAGNASAAVARAKSINQTRASATVMAVLMGHVERCQTANCAHLLAELNV